MIYSSKVATPDRAVTIRTVHYILWMSTIICYLLPAYRGEFNEAIKRMSTPASFKVAQITEIPQVELVLLIYYLGVGDGEVYVREFSLALPTILILILWFWEPVIEFCQQLSITTKIMICEIWGNNH